jgi:hypothetical protein
MPATSDIEDSKIVKSRVFAWVGISVGLLTGVDPRKWAADGNRA